jgi:hypothetical protein
MKSMTTPTVQTSIAFISTDVELDFSTLTRLLGREPDETRFLNSLTASGQRPHLQRSIWCVTTDAIVVDSIDEGIQALFELFSGEWDQVYAFCEQNSYEVSVTSRVTIHDWDDRPFIELSGLTNTKLCSLGAKWQLDLVDLSR